MGDYLSGIEQMILYALVRLRENAYGMTIRREIEERTGRNISIGTVYTTLLRLEEKGYVSSRVGDPTPERGGRAKRYFEIKGAGARALQESEGALSSMRAGLRLGTVTR